MMERDLKVYKRAMRQSGATDITQVIKDMASSVDILVGEAEALGRGVEYVNTHLVLRLYIEALGRVGKVDKLTWLGAYRFVKGVLIAGAVELVDRKGEFIGAGGERKVSDDSRGMRIW